MSQSRLLHGQEIPFQDWVWGMWPKGRLGKSASQPSAQKPRDTAVRVLDPTSSKRQQRVPAVGSPAYRREEGTALHTLAQNSLTLSSEDHGSTVQCRHRALHKLFQRHKMDLGGGVQKFCNPQIQGPSGSCVLHALRKKLCPNLNNSAPKSTPFKCVCYELFEAA